MIVRIVPRATGWTASGYGIVSRWPAATTAGVAEAAFAHTRAGQKVLNLRTVPGRDELATAGLCADAHGFSLHAGVRCDEHQRKRLERLCRYITRPAIANERLKRDGAGNVVLQLKSPWRDGTTHIVMSPQEFMQRLAALVPMRVAVSVRRNPPRRVDAETEESTRHGDLHPIPRD